uniref:Uncharacterized protein n=1 Tax=viral metagenome TaxID=1070528 RepID=A0A6M3X5I6_9ZZZZ
MNFLDWVKKYLVVIAFLFGVATGILTMYYGFNSRLDTMDNRFDTVDFKVNLIQSSADREYENIYEVLHRQRQHINKATELLEK